MKGTVLDYGPTETTFTRDKLERAFGGVLRHFTLGGTDLHDDDDAREVTIISDDERPFVQYGERRSPSSAVDAALDGTGHEHALETPGEHALDAPGDGEGRR